MLDKLRERALYLKTIMPGEKKYNLIIELLQNDDCFFKINSSDAYMILRDLKIKEDKLVKVYASLISGKNYKGDIYE